MSKFYRSLMRSLKQVRATEYSKRTGKRDWEYVRFELWCSFLDTFYYSWMTPIRRFLESCSNIIRWFPTIWEDRFWDHTFILKILKKKLEFTAKDLKKYGHHTEVDRDVNNINIAVYLIDRILEGAYSNHNYEELEKKWGKIEFGDGGMYRTKVVTEEDKKNEAKEHKRVWEHEAYMKKQDYKYLFDHLQKHLEQWWD